MTRQVGLIRRTIFFKDIIFTCPSSFYSFNTGRSWTNRITKKTAGEGNTGQATLEDSLIDGLPTGGAKRKVLQEFFFDLFHILLSGSLRTSIFCRSVLYRNICPTPHQKYNGHLCPRDLRLIA